MMLDRGSQEMRIQPIKKKKKEQSRFSLTLKKSNKLKQTFKRSQVFKKQCSLAEIIPYWQREDRTAISECGR